MLDREKIVGHFYNCLLLSKPENMCVFVRKDVVGDTIALLKERDNCENCAIAIEDRQPVVRCKDCKYWHPLFKPDGYCDCDDMWRSLEGETTEVEYIRTNEDFYCGYAESGR